MLPFEVGKPDDESGSNDTQIAQCVAHHVEENTAHVEIMAMAMTTFSLLFRLVVSVISMTVSLGPSSLRCCACSLGKQWRSFRRSLIYYGGLAIGIRSGFFHPRRFDDAVPER